jgi:hypothetical protein
MDIFKEKQKQQYLILAAIGMIIIAAGILFYGSFADKNVLAPDVRTNQYRKPVINWAILESPELKELQIP